MYLKTIIIFTFICIELTVQPIHASCHWREADLCLATLAVYGNVYGVIPHTEKGMEVFCQYIKESHNCVGEFARNCFTKDLFDSGYPMVESTVLFYDKFCTKGSPTQKEWLQHAPCMSEHFNETKPCVEYALAGIENLAIIDNKDRFATICCVFNNIMECIKNVLSKNCEMNTDEMVKTIMRNMVSDVPIVACKKFEARSKRCISLLPPEGSKSKGKESDNELVKLMAEFLTV